MTYTGRLSVRVAAAALVTFSASCFISSAAVWAQPVKKLEYAGEDVAGNVGQIVSQLNHGAVVIVFNPNDGSMIARALKRQGPNPGITVYQKDENGENIWYNKMSGKPEDPPVPPISAPGLKGAGIITDIRIYTGSDCVMCNLNGKWITVCR